MMLPAKLFIQKETKEFDIFSLFYTLISIFNINTVIQGKFISIQPLFDTSKFLADHFLENI